MEGFGGFGIVGQFFMVQKESSSVLFSTHLVAVGDAVASVYAGCRLFSDGRNMTQKLTSKTTSKYSFFARLTSYLYSILLPSPTYTCTHYLTYCLIIDCVWINVFESSSSFRSFPEWDPLTPSLFHHPPLKKNHESFGQQLPTHPEQSPACGRPVWPACHGSKLDTGGARSDRAVPKVCCAGSKCVT